MNRPEAPRVRELFKEHVLLRDLPEEDLDRLARLATVRRYDAGQTIFLKGNPGHGMMVVLSGLVRICASSPEGKEVVLNTIYPGEVFGEIALIDGVERTADAVAVERCELLGLERNDFLPYLENNPDICVKLLQVICKRIRTTSEQLEDFSFLDLRHRIAKRLVSLAENGGSDGDIDGATVRITQQDLSAMMGTTREAVNKQLRTLDEIGVIEQKRGAIVIVDGGRLQEVVESR